MSLPAEVESLNPRLHETMHMHGCWGWFLAFGIALILLGVAAISAQFVATLTSVLVFGCLLLAGGGVQIVNAILARHWRAFFVSLLVGILHIVVGGLMIDRPDRAAEALT
jgi:uncharacterized membrane protein HdeD (DUF308 family)